MSEIPTEADSKRGQRQELELPPKIQARQERFFFKKMNLSVFSLTIRHEELSKSSPADLDSFVETRGQDIRIFHCLYLYNTTS